MPTGRHIARYTKMPKKLKIVSVASEVAPFSKTGGLADVARSLPKALRRLGHEVIVITPLYEQIIDKEKYRLKLAFENVNIHLDENNTATVNYWKGYLMKGLPIYFMENKKYFSKSKNIYGSPRENARFFIFNLAALKLISLLEFEANIIHCHDWHTGLIPYILKSDPLYAESDLFKKIKTVFTIHNLAFQLGRNWWEVPAEKRDGGKTKLPNIDNSDFEYINFAKRAIIHADAVNTVSEQYREEIMTKGFGQNLDQLLCENKHKLFGIINGIDYKTYNPKLDPGLLKNYDCKNWEAKKINKEHLQKLINLPVEPNTPIIGLTSRITFQKGYELIIELLGHLLKKDVQIIIMGDGDKQYINELKKINKKHPKKIIWLPFSENKDRETLIYAGSDIFLLPSYHEPCGINQLIAMRYGCIPVVRKVGGLHDTVRNYNPRTNKGIGFTFENFDIVSLHGAVIRAVENYYHKDVWATLIKRAMKESNSWKIPAQKYENLYKKVIKSKF